MVTQNSLNNSSSPFDVNNIHLATNTISISNVNGTLDVLSNGTGGINLGTNATAHATNVGTSTASATLVLNAPAAGMTIGGFTEGAVITSSSGVVSTVTGTAGFVLTANAAGTAPSFKAAGGGGPSVYFSGTISSATFTNTGGVPYTMLWDTAPINVGAGLNTSTGVFTAPTTGMYSFSGFMTWENFATTTILMGASINSATIQLITWYCNPVTMKDLGSNRLAVPFAFYQQLTAGDTVEIIMSSADNLVGVGTISPNVWAQFNGQSVGF